MSKEGIQKFAQVLSVMQETRNELIAMGTTAQTVDKQDILLGQLLDTAKDAVKGRFCEITMGKL